MSELTDKLKNYNFENPTYVDTKEMLDQVGPGMCLAKWTQVTLQLQNGHNHSCHHPKTHPISINEISRNPSALHNTKYKKLRRKEMLNGSRPTECDYCWGVEDNSDRFSDRIFKSSENWSLPFYNDIVNTDWREDFNPRYVEVAFSNTCNFKCSYCGPAYSTMWLEEVEEFGGYKTSTNFNDMFWLQHEEKMPLRKSEYNPYTEAFWKWWPELYNDLHTFRITGGEPLLAKDTWKVLDFIIQNPNPNKKLNLSINSNLGVPDRTIDQFIEKINKIIDEGRINEFIIFTSCDAWGKHAEYIRHGLEFNRFWDNVNKILTKCPRVNLTFMVTYNALSVFSYDKLIRGVYDLKKEYGSSDRYWPSATMLDSSYLRFPWHQTVQILPRDFKENILEHAKLALYYGVPIFNHKFIGYSDVEIQKLKRIYDWSLGEGTSEKHILQHQKDFHTFFSEHDRRRNTNFIETFPELEEFYHFCKHIKL